MSVEIKKAKIKNGIFLSYEYVEKTSDTENKISTSSDAPIHEDLREAFQALVPHFGLLTEEFSTFSNDEETRNKFKVTGFTIGGSGDTEGIVISGHKKLESGKVVNFNTPFTKFDEENYDHIDELNHAIECLKSEVFEYMEGKQAQRSDVGTFDFPEDDEQEAFSLSGDETSEE